MVYKVWDTTAVPELMSEWTAVIYKIVDKGWDITAAPEIMSPWAAMIGTIIYKV